jgi:hypothetical protein
MPNEEEPLSVAECDCIGEVFHSKIRPILHFALGTLH